MVSPNTFKRLNDFRHGVLDHVKSYYNSSLWQTDSKAPSVLSTPVVAEKPLQVQNGTHAGMPNQLKEAETLKRPSSETETEMPEMSEVSPSLQNGNKHSKKQLVSVGLSNKGDLGQHMRASLSVACSLLPQIPSYCSALHHGAVCGVAAAWFTPLYILTKDPACRVPFAHNKTLNFVPFAQNSQLCEP